VLCAKAKRGTPVGSVRIRAECNRREVPIDPAALGLQVAGPPGPAGADGQLRIYGDGSAGPRTVTGDETLEDANRQYTDFTVGAGVTLTVPSGTVIRCTGQFVNNGTIVVGTASPGAKEAVRNSTIDSTYQPPGQGVALTAAARGELGPAGNFYFGGFGGIGLTATQARSILQPGVSAGGGGACGVFAGGDGGGGGAGGVVVLASKARVDNRGVLSAKGGAGGANGTSDGPGGGGGGGIVHLLAPVIDDSGVVAVDGGSAGPLTATKAVGLRAGGGAGGSCGGGGGAGGSVSSDDSAQSAAPGGVGHALKTQVDPTALF